MVFSECCETSVIHKICSYIKSRSFFFGFYLIVHQSKNEKPNKCILYYPQINPDVSSKRGESLLGLSAMYEEKKIRMSSEI